ASDERKKGQRRHRQSRAPLRQIRFPKKEDEEITLWRLYDQTGSRLAFACTTKQPDYSIERGTGRLSTPSRRHRREAADFAAARLPRPVAPMRFSRVLAMIFGIGAPVAETVRRCGTWR